MQIGKSTPVFDTLGLMVGVIPNWFVRTSHYAELTFMISFGLLVIPPLIEIFLEQEIDAWWYGYPLLVTTVCSFLHLMWSALVKESLCSFDKDPTWPGEGWLDDVWTDKIDQDKKGAVTA